MQVWVQTYDSKKGSLKHKGPVQTKHTKNTGLKKKLGKLRFISQPLLVSVAKIMGLERRWVGIGQFFELNFQRSSAPL